MNAGTIEFLLEKDENFYFMEMNTRIQVEHPVTEMGHWHGSGKRTDPYRFRSCRFQVSQKDIHVQGHAIECRINAENPEKNFRPSPGTISDISFSWRQGNPCGYSYLSSGYTVPPYYDSMIAKIDRSCEEQRRGYCQNEKRIGRSGDPGSGYKY